MTVGAISCKDLSKSSNKRKQDCLRTGTGTSGRTLYGLLSALDNSESRAYIGENADELASLSSENRQAMDEAFAEIGWVVIAELLNHRDYGGLSRRGRAYIIALHLERCNMTAVEGRACLRKMCLA